MRTMSVQVHIAGSDAEQSDRATRQLRRELLELDVEDVRPARHGTAPADAKGDPATTGTLLVDLANSAGLAAIFQLISTWVTRGNGRSITIEDGDRKLTINGADPQQHQQIIDAFVNDTSRTADRHTP